MTLYLSDILSTLIIFNINMWVIAKGLRVKKLEGERTRIVEKFLFSKEKKETKIHYLVLVFNILIVLIQIMSSFIRYIKEKKTFLQAISTIINQINQNYMVIFFYIVIICILILISMSIIYRSVNFELKEKDENGNRHLNISEIDREYINFSKPERVDGHSTLLLIAGDLSFLGDIPDLKSISRDKSRKRCKEYLSDISQTHSCCKRGCPRAIKGKCIEKSEQFAQLLELKRKGVTLRVICKKPNDSNDVAYKLRLGRLKKIFANSMDIRFLPDNVSEGGICVLGRIKENGGIKELFWHWKDPEKAEAYIVPDTKKIDSSENKTLIYLLETVLWQFSHKIEDGVIEEYINKYEEIIKS